jgi:hypothetical protein
MYPTNPGLVEQSTLTRKTTFSLTYLDFTTFGRSYTNENAKIDSVSINLSVLVLSYRPEILCPVKNRCPKLLVPFLKYEGLF